MSDYPTSIDTDVSLPPVNDNLDDIGEAAVNALRDAVVNIEEFVGTGVSGQLSLAQRLGLLIQPDGYFNFAYLTGMGLVTLPIYDNQIAAGANIQESKLNLTFGTQDLYDDILVLGQGVETVTNWISVSGVKLEPHLVGAIYRHDLTQIDVIENSVYYLNSVFRTAVGVNINRSDHNGNDNVNAFLMLNDINNELTFHQWADGSQPPYTLADGYVTSSIQNIITNGGYIYPSNYAHTASGIYLDTNGFAVIPQTITDVQAAISYIDQKSLTLLGSRVQNLYSNGISVNSRSSALDTDGYGPVVVASTPAITYLRGTGTNTCPTDDIAMGDDMIQLVPTGGQKSGNLFDAQFALIRVGDIIIVNYANDGYNIEVPYVISEKKYKSTPSESYFIRIAGKNIMYAPSATAIIYRPLFNNNKYGVLSVASGATSASIAPSLIIGNPNGAQCAGVGFNPDQFDPLHYLLYLELYPYGNPLDGYAIKLPGIDVTGNQGATPGAYTLDSIVQATNNAFRQPGYNYRFTAFEFQGEFGIIADPYNNASFSVISNFFPNNVVDLFPASGASVAQDPLGLGPNGSGVASPPFSGSYDTTQSASGFPTRVFNALQQNNYYVNGAERQNLNSDIYQTFDAYGDGYWPATIDGYYAGNPQATIYNIDLDLSASGLKAGKTIVVQPHQTNLGNQVNYGRFVIQDVQFLTCSNNSLMTQITVFNSVHGTGSLASAVAPTGSPVSIYFSSDSVSFDEETSTDFSSFIHGGQFKRHFEVYADANGDTYTHERSRIYISPPPPPSPPSITVNGVTNALYTTSTLSQLDIVTVSSTLRGYIPVSGLVNSITLTILGLNIAAGVYDGYMWDGYNAYTAGPFITGRIGEVTRFYDQTNIDYIDIIFGLNNSTIADFGPQIVPPTASQSITFQLFPSLASDQEVMLIASCQENTSTSAVTQIKDRREFGNVSEEQLTTSALNYISAGDKYLHFNGVIRGFGIVGNTPVPVTNVTYGMLAVNGGVALVDGNLVSINNQVFIIPPIVEVDSYGNPHPINYALCVNSEGELVTIVITNYDPVIVTNTVSPRSVYVVNRALPGNPKYQIDCCDFSYLLNDRKDLTVLYIISSVVTGVGPTPGATTALTIRDVRRFVNDADSSLPAVVTDDKSQGNFESLSSAIAWLYFNTAYQNIVQVKGIQVLSYTDALPLGLQLIGTGDGATIFVHNPDGYSITLNDITFENLFITVTSYNAFTLGSNVTFNNCTFIYDVDCSTATSPPLVYNELDLVNAGCGLIYANLSSTGTEMINNINITNCTFGNVYEFYFPFISIQFSDASAMAQNINISNNIFLSEIPDDLRAIISFTSIDIVASATYPLYPKLVNTYISNNICNQSQLILISGQPDSDGYMSEIYLTAVNTHISNNTCGTIGYFISANDTADSYNTYSPTTPLNIRNQFDSLIISGNTCHLIASLNSNGHFIPFLIYQFGSFTETVIVPTGQVDIIDNTVSWISVGTYGLALNKGHGVRINDNKLNPGDSVYLIPYTTGIPSSSPTYNALIPNIGINLMLGSYQSSSSIYNDNTQSIISRNMLTQNTMYVNNSDNSSNPNGGIANSGIPYYYLSGILCNSNALVSNNFIDGVVQTGCLIQILSSIANVTVINNILKRLGQIITAYVGGNLSNTNSICVITDNTFDSIYTDSGSIFNDENTLIPVNWTYTRNTNQVSYVAIPLWEHNSKLTPSTLLTPYGGATLCSFYEFDASSTPLDNTNTPLSIRLANILPFDTSILYAVLGINDNNGNITASTTGKIWLQLDINKLNAIITPVSPTAYGTNSNAFGSTYANTMLDVFNNNLITSVNSWQPAGASIGLTSSGSGVSDINSKTIYLNMDMSLFNYLSQSPYPVKIGKGFEVLMSLIFQDVTTSALTNLWLSPLIIRYVWG
jgi:hypothetical protein